MSESDWDNDEEEYSSEYSSGFDVEDDAFNQDDVEGTVAQYTYPTAETASGVRVERMKYEPISVEYMEKVLQDKVAQLDSVLQLGEDACRVLLIEYEWRDDRLLEDFTNKGASEVKKAAGLGDVDATKKLLYASTDEAVLCNICFCSGSKAEPMMFFRLSGCEHPFCADCYSHYIREANSVLRLTIRCPGVDCDHVILLHELETLSEYAKEQAEAEESRKKRRVIVPLTEEQIREKYQGNEDDDEDGWYSDMELDYEASKKKKEDEERKRKADEEAEDMANAMNFDQWLFKKEIEERQRARDSTLVSRYTFNVANNYCLNNLRNFKCCPFPDCDLMVMQLGFDSSVVASLDELVARHLIPTVQCLSKHQFCYHCVKENHTPCPCSQAQKWLKKVKDGKETEQWIYVNTRDCPKCHTPIEKNGGCNYMCCFKCHYAFCWICMGDWAKHNDHFNCIKYPGSKRPPQDDEKEKTREQLKRYQFYSQLFDGERVSLLKDRLLLGKLERQLHAEQAREISWVQISFFRDAVDILLQARGCLMWTYPAIYYVSGDSSPSLLEGAQFTLQRQIEKLSKLFLDTEASNVLKRKASFLNSSAMVLKARQALEELFLECFVTEEVKLD